MKMVKIKKSLLKKPMPDILRELGVVIDNQSYPSLVFMSEQDISIIKKSCRKEAKKQYPYAEKRRIDMVAGMEFLNYGPNSTLEKAIKPGYAIIDDQELRAIKNHNEKLAKEWNASIASGTRVAECGDTILSEPLPDFSSSRTPWLKLSVWQFFQRLFLPFT
jgi:hypothetical protein